MKWYVNLAVIASCLLFANHLSMAQDDPAPMEDQEAVVQDDSAPMQESPVPEPMVDSGIAGGASCLDCPSGTYVGPVMGGCSGTTGYSDTTGYSGMTDYSVVDGSYYSGDQTMIGSGCGCGCSGSSYAPVMADYSTGYDSGYYDSGWSSGGYVGGYSSGCCNSGWGHRHIWSGWHGRRSCGYGY